MTMQPKKILTAAGLTELVSKNDNFYETTVVVAKRAKQINLQAKEELKDKLAEFVSVTDNLEEIIENKEQIEIAKFYERQPKPVLVAAEECLNGQLAHWYLREEDVTVR